MASTRTIPTRVGSTCPQAVLIGPSSDHPHAGGEHQFLECTNDGISGPSPRGWGAPGYMGDSRRSNRTIPTRVGSTHSWRSVVPCRADHPHAGGEHRDDPFESADSGGPSPRGWGARHRLERIAVAHRTIPTRVGSTMTCADAQPSRPDHPHAGGEHASRLVLGSVKSGPSPRGWGAQHPSSAGG